MGAKTGTAPRIRELKLKYPEMTDSQIARAAGCTPSNVTQVLQTFLGTRSQDELREYQENQADVFDAIGLRLLGTITQDKLDKLKPVEAITGAAILFDKTRLLRGQATGINVTVLMDVVEAMRAKSNVMRELPSNTVEG